MLDDILQSSSVTTKQAESLRGRLHWFESFAFGRVANGAVKTLGDLSLRRSKKRRYNSETMKSGIFVFFGKESCRRHL